MVDAPPCQVSPSGYAALGGRSCASLSWMRGFRATTWRGGRAACLEGPKNEGRKDMEPVPPLGPLGPWPWGPMLEGLSFVPVSWAVWAQASPHNAPP